VVRVRIEAWRVVTVRPIVDVVRIRIEALARCGKSWNRGPGEVWF
jgi:hypothetical protein